MATEGFPLIANTELINQAEAEALPYLSSIKSPPLNHTRGGVGAPLRRHLKSPSQFQGPFPGVYNI